MSLHQPSLFKFLFLFFLMFSSSLLASTDTGINWLLQHVNNDNNYTSTSTVATPLQSLSELHNTLVAYEMSVPSKVLEQINSYDLNNTEYLSRQIIANVQVDANTSLYVNQLFKHQTEVYGNFAEFENYHGTILDTAFALEALYKNGNSGLAINYAVAHLVEKQQEDGSWKDGNNKSSIYVTAMALRSLWKFHLIYDVVPNITKAKEYLLSHKTNGAWKEDYLTAQVLISVLPLLEDTKEVTSAIDLLLTSQKSNGSWEDDIFVTSLALQALERAKQPVGNEFLASIRGVILDADTNKPLAGAHISYAGKSTQSRLDGTFSITAITAGTYLIEVEKEEYSPLSGDISVAIYQRLDIGTLLMPKTQDGVTTGTIRGTVKDSNNILLSGVHINAGTLNTVTDSDGSFQLSNVATGNLKIIASKDNYFTVSLDTNIKSNVTLLFSPEMQKIASVPDIMDSVLFGSIIDNDNNNSLIGVSVALENSSTQLTSSEGSFLFSELSAGSYTLTLSKAGYNKIRILITVDSSENFNIGTIRLQKTTEDDLLATLQGKITDRETGLAIKGVTLVAGEKTAITDENGYYIIENLELLYISISTESLDYYPASAMLEVETGLQANFSPSLRKIPASTLYGTIRDANSSNTLENVLIKVIGNEQVQSATNADGTYQITLTKEGEFSIELSKEGYDILTIATHISKGNQVEFSPSLYPSGTTPEHTNSASLMGTLVHSQTNEKLSNITITMDENTTSRTIQTDNEGKFLFEGIKTADITLHVDVKGFIPVSFMMPVNPLNHLDIGEIRLRPLEVVKLLPDLVIDDINSSSIISDAFSLLVEGTLRVSIKNIGNKVSSQSTGLLAFNDANNNNRYDSDIDTLLGTEFLTDTLDIDANTSMLFYISGVLPFKDAPITLWIDSNENIIELDEVNNFYSSAKAKKLDSIKVGELKPVVKWHWDGYNSYQEQYNQVMVTPLVAQLNDDNNDSKINNEDIPDIVFTTFYSYKYIGRGILRAISGKDGSSLWDTNWRTPVGTVFSGAIADIDNDGLVEIVYGSSIYSGISVFENDGTLKWSKPSTMSGEVVLADFDHDGNVEILIGGEIFDADGNLLASFETDDTIPIVADIDMDGVQDIISGGNAYDFNGSLKWSNSEEGLFPAIANLDEDDYPEIIFRSANGIYVTEHTGELKWGPVAIPGGGGGAATVSDLDGDGEAEISVAGGSNYIVYETDGSIKWISPTEDFSSLVTGSTVFDFEGDGKTEILYSDERNFRIYNGETGDILYEMINPSGTVYEYPVVADVDNDGHAEIVLASNNYYRPGTTGVRVLENEDDNWAPTRKIWNQHSYHISNINDDGTIPKNEKPSWLTHNTYRLNTFADHDALETTDLTASLLRIVDNGASKPYTLKVRVGNGGIVTSPQSIVHFYDGNPELNATLIGSISVSEIETNRYVDLELGNVENLAGNDIYVMVDASYKISEVNELNNIISIPFSVSNVLASVEIMISETNTTANTPVTLTSLISNDGSLAQTFSILSVIKDSSGSVVTRLDPISSGEIEANNSITLTQNWDTGSILSGTYYVETTLYDNDENIIDSDSKSFSINAGSSDGSLEVATLSISTNKPIYHTTDTLNLKSVLKNLSLNAIIKEASLHVSIENSANTSIYTTSTSLGDLLPNAIRETSLQIPFINIDEDTYTVKSRLIDNEGSVVATSSITCKVEEDSTLSLVANMEVEFKELESGETQVCKTSFFNSGKNALTNIPTRTLLIEASSKNQVTSVDTLLSIASDTTLESNTTFETSSLNEGEYLCILQTKFDDMYESIASDSFVVTKKAIQITPSVQKGTHAPLLILLDSVHEHGWFFGMFSSGYEGHDPYGPYNAPLLKDQRTYLENLLDANGYHYKIVDTQAEFVTELRSGNYSTIALFNEYINLHPQIQGEIREAVRRGAGLLFAGKHQSFNDALERPLGVDFGYMHDHVEVLHVEDSQEYSASDITLVHEDVATRFRAVDATPLASFEIESGFFNFIPSSEKYALTHNSYGAGEAVFVAFDLLMQASSTNAPHSLERLLLEILQDIEPTSSTAYRGSVYPLSLTLSNEAIAIEGYIQSRVEGGEVLHVSRGVIDDEGIAHTSFSLSENVSEELIYQIKVAPSSNYIDLISDIYTGVEGSEQFYQSITHSVEVDTTKNYSLQDALDASNALGWWSLNLVEFHLSQAIYHESHGHISYALTDAVIAADILSGMHNDTEALRNKLAFAISILSQKQ